MKKIKHFTPYLIVLLFCLACCCQALLRAEADPFYIKVFNEGKTFLETGNYKEAAKNFEIAEFGLLAEPQIKEVYLYYALAKFHLGKTEDARELINKFEKELKKPGSKSFTIPPAVEKPLTAMLASLKRMEISEKITSRDKIYNIEMLSLQITKDLQAGKLQDVPANILELEKVDKKDARIFYFKGILAFKQNDYKSCIKVLDKISPNALDTGLMDEVYYYLTLAHFYLGNMKKIGVYYNQIKDRATRYEAYKIIKKEK